MGMKRPSRWAAVAAIAGVLPQGATAAPPEPTGKWVVNFEPAQCIASRSYGTEEEPLMLVLKAPVTGSTLQLFVIRKGRKGSAAEQLKGGLAIAGEAKAGLSVLAYSPKGEARRVFLFNLPRDSVAAWPSKGSLEVRAGASIREGFALSGLQPLLKIMDKCVADLRDYWNFSDETIASKHRRRAEANLIRVFSANDYPSISLREGDTGTVRVVLLVDPTGKVADCSLVETSGVAVLDAQTCVLIRERAQLRPAIGVDGKPARDVFLQRVTWSM